MKHFSNACAECVGIIEKQPSILLPAALFSVKQISAGTCHRQVRRCAGVECLALGMEQFKETIVSLLKEVLSEDGISIRGVYERSDANERKKEGLAKVKGFIGEEFDTNVEIVENGVHYMVDVVNGQKTGFFLRSKVQSSRDAAHLQRQKSVGLLYAYGNLCAKCRNRGCNRGNRT